MKSKSSISNTAGKEKRQGKIGNNSIVKLLRASIPVISGLIIIMFCAYALANSRVSAASDRLPVRFGTESELESYLSESVDNETDEIVNNDVLPTRIVETLKVVQYKVKKGDSLSSISQKYGLYMDTIVSFNNIKTIQSIVPGITLTIPNTNGIRYRVGNGDCLSCIASKYKVPLNSILDWNDIKSETIKAGMSLFIPGGRMNRTELNKVLGMLFIWPVKGTISSTYGYRIHPIDGTKSFHNGLDISGIIGTPIKAAMAGRIMKIGKNFLYGNYVILGHDEGFQTLYGHLSKVTSSEGKSVEQGAKIGEMGNTGYSTGVHLHFSIFKDGDTVDPMKYLK